MAVTEVLRGLGSWNLSLSENIPDYIWDAIKSFGHITVHVGRVNPVISGDSLLRSSRYTGVIQAHSDAPTARVISGYGMNLWLADADGKGNVIEELITITDATLPVAITQVLPNPGPVTIGEIFDVGDTFSGSFQFMSPRDVIDYICQTMSGENAWRVNGDATLDAGSEADLFVVDPKTIVVRKQLNGFNATVPFGDLYFKGLNGQSSTSQDVEDFTTRLLLISQETDGVSASATADINPGLNPYKDLYGNPVVRTRIAVESETNPGNAAARAQLQLNRFTGTRDELELSTAQYDINGDVRIGDYIWIFDPSMNLIDNGNEIQFRGKRINPMKLQLKETNWPIVKGMSVSYRDWDGNWFDLTPYIRFETGDTALVVGGYNRSLTNPGGGGIFPVTPPEIDTTVPGQVVWSEPFNQSIYRSPTSGETRAEVELRWVQPDNVDTSEITDGSHYEIRYRVATTPIFDVSFEDTSSLSFNDVNTWEEPIVYPATDWSYAYAPFDSQRYRIQELAPSMPYEAQIRAVDASRPPHAGAWSALVEFQTSRDIIPPATPAAPEIASNPMAVQMVHHLGRSDGGTFNLDRDLDHLELHGGHEPLFTPTANTLLGKVSANWGMITGEVPIVQSFQITATNPVVFKVVAVDESGNKSLPSPGVQASAGLIDEEYISHLTVSKITAGIISADWILGSYIRTGTEGARVELSHQGIHGYNANGVRLLDWKSSDGSLNVISDSGVKVSGSGGIAVEGSGGIAVRGGGNIEITDGSLIVYNSNGNKVVELGECADGRHGLQVFMDNGRRVVRTGELESGTEGIELIADDGSGRLVRLSTLAFEMQAASDTGSVSVSSTSFSGSSPLVNVAIGNTGRALIFISGWCSAIPHATIPGGGATYGFRMAGPGGVVIEADLIRAVGVSSSISAGIGRAFLATGLAPGNWLVSSRYRSAVGGVSAVFTDRHIAVQPF